MLSKQAIRSYRPHIHFLIAALFFTSYLSGENDIETLHYYSGYALIAFFSFRLMWDITDHGFRILSWRLLINILRGSAKLGYKFQRFTSVLLSFLLPFLLISGLVFHGAYNEEGLLYFIGAHSTNQFIDIAEEVHEILSKLLLIIALSHIPMGFRFLKVTKFYKIYQFKKVK
ncbi:MAG: hypothetical protein K0U39_05455 [Alphaproteobacteria bacterium]|nr:hypothetical protein [Alphaproteobacteria bacterium]